MLFTFIEVGCCCWLLIICAVLYRRSLKYSDAFGCGRTERLARASMQDPDRSIFIPCGDFTPCQLPAEGFSAAFVTDCQRCQVVGHFAKASESLLRIRLPVNSNVVCPCIISYIGLHNWNKNIFKLHFTNIRSSICFHGEVPRQMPGVGVLSKVTTDKNSLMSRWLIMIYINQIQVVSLPEKNRGARSLPACHVPGIDSTQMVL